jgi:hypothetical protein
MVVNAPIFSARRRGADDRIGGSSNAQAHESNGDNPLPAPGPACGDLRVSLERDGDDLGSVVAATSPAIQARWLRLDIDAGSLGALIATDAQ